MMKQHTVTRWQQYYENVRQIVKLMKKFNSQQKHQTHKTRRINIDELKIILQMPTMQLAKIKIFKNLTFLNIRSKKFDKS